MISSLGRTTFEDSTIPVPGKSEFGMDTLTRKMKGFVGTGGVNLIAFIASLSQGQVFSFGFIPFYLQTWQSDDDTPIATVTLNYKGLKTGGTPLPIVESEIVSASGAKSADYSTENGGKGRVYRTGVVYGTGTQANVIAATQEIYTTGAVMEFTYDAAQSSYRYISVGKPNGPRYSSIDIAHSPQIKTARVTTSDGFVYGLSVPISIGPSLQPSPESVNVGFISRPVIGSPYWECSEIVRQELR